MFLPFTRTRNQMLKDGFNFDDDPPDPIVLVNTAAVAAISTVADGTRLVISGGYVIDITDGRDFVANLLDGGPG